MLTAFELDLYLAFEILLSYSDWTYRYTVIGLASLNVKLLGRPEQFPLRNVFR